MICSNQNGMGEARASAGKPEVAVVDPAGCRAQMQAWSDGAEAISAGGELYDFRRLADF